MAIAREFIIGFSTMISSLVEAKDLLPTKLKMATVQRIVKAREFNQGVTTVSPISIANATIPNDQDASK